MARRPEHSIATEPRAKKPTKLAIVEQLLRQPNGASIAELMSATGWQQHSVRGVIAGSLRKKGIAVGSSVIDGERRYTVEAKA